MTEQAARRPSLWRHAGQATIKKFARTTMGGKFLRATYDAYFEFAGGHQRIFRSLYRDFSSAAADAPAGKQLGYDGDATTTRHAHERHFLYPSDYPILFWLSRLLPQSKLLFDLGGDVGNRYLAFRKYLTYPEHLTWLVNDIPAVVAFGRRIAEQEASAHLQFSADRIRLKEADILLASGVLQVLEDWDRFLQAEPTLPRHLLINRTPVSNQPYAVTLHSIGVAFVPYQIFNREVFVSAFVSLGYRLVDEWITPELGCLIPDQPSYSLKSYSGFYFTLEREDTTAGTPGT